MKASANRKQLSRALIDRADTRALQYRIWDSIVPSLCVIVYPSGIKSFNVRWSRGKVTPIGKHPEMLVEAARKKASAIINETSATGSAPAVVLAKKARADAFTLGDFVDKHYMPWASTHQDAGEKTAKSIRSAFADFLDFDLNTPDAWPGPISKWTTARYKAGRAVATVNRNLASLHSAINYAIVWKLIDVNPIRDIKLRKLDNQRVRYLNEEEEIGMRAALTARDRESIAARHRTNVDNRLAGRPLLPEPKRGDYFDFLHPLVIVALNTGMRRGELRKLEWPQVDFARSTVFVKAAAAKSKKSRFIPLNPEAIHALKKWRDQAPGMKEVFGKFGEFRKTWETLMAQAGIVDFHFHDLRHTFASRLVQNGEPLNTVRDLMGHKDLTMTLRYAHLNDQCKVSAVATLVPRIKRSHAKKVA